MKSLPHQDIDALFGNARRSGPFTDLKEIDALIQSGGTSFSKQRSPSINLNIILMITLISMIVTGVLFFQPAKHSTDSPVKNIRESLREEFKQAPLLAPNEAQNNHNYVPSPENPANQVAAADSDVVQPLNMNGIRILQLGESALAKLGVLVCKNGASVPMTSGKNGERLMFTQEGSIISMSDAEAKKIGFTEKEVALLSEYRITEKSFPHPRFITDDLGQYWRVYVSDKADSLNHEQRVEAMQKKLNTLIPVLVRTGDVFTVEDSIEMRWRPDFILWYEPTEEFLALLPALTGADIKKEKDMILSIATPVNADSAMTTGTAEDAHCRYFESCESDRRIMSQVLVYPNPAREKISVKIELRSARNLSFHIAGISGRTVLPLQKPILQKEGVAEYEFDLSSLPEGIYLLTVLTDKNEKYTVRVVKE